MNTGTETEDPGARDEETKKEQHWLGPQIVCREYDEPFCGAPRKPERRVNFDGETTAPSCGSWLLRFRNPLSQRRLFNTTLSSAR